MKKKVIALILVFVMMLGLLPASAAEGYQITVNPISIEVGGQDFLPTDINGKNVPVFEYNGTTYAPLRALAEAYGLSVGYDQSKNLAYVEGTASTEGFAGTKGTARALTQRTTITVEPINIEVGGAVFQPKDANGKAVEVFVYDGTTYAPLRALAEAYGLIVGYDANAKLAFVTDGAVQDINAFIEPMETVEEGFDALVEYLVVLSEFYHFEVADASYETFADGSVYWMVGMNLMGHTPTGSIVTPWSEVPCDIYVQGIDDPALGYDVQGYYDYDTSVFYMRDDNVRYAALGFSPAWLFSEEGAPTPPSDTTDEQTPSVELTDGQTLAANPIDVSTGNPVLDGRVLPDPWMFSNGIYETEDGAIRSGQEFLYGLSSWDDENMAVVEAYVDLLVSEFGFEVVGEYDLSGNRERYWSRGLNSTAIEGRRTQEMQYDSSVTCDLQVWVNKSRSKVEMYVYCGAEFSFADTGHRYGAAREGMSYGGPSAGAGLVRNADGSYSTTDGRLSAAVGTAMVIRDGVAYTTSVECVVEESGVEEISLGDYYRGETIRLRIGENGIYDGDVYSLYDLMRYESYAGQAFGKDEIVNHGWSDIMLSAAWNGEYYVVSPQEESPYADMTLRVMHRDEGGDAVYYAYFEFISGEPTTVEALIVVDGANATDEAAESIVRLSTGESVTLRITNRPFMPNYETFDWRIVDGDAVTVEGTGAEATVTAVKSGSATVEVEYHYGLDEPDILTGIIRNEPHSETHRFLIVVD